MAKATQVPEVPKTQTPWEKVEKGTPYTSLAPLEQVQFDAHRTQLRRIREEEEERAFRAAQNAAEAETNTPVADEE